MLMAETLSSVSSSTVVKTYIFCDFKIFCSVPQRVCVFELFTEHATIFSGSNWGFIPSEAEIYLISKAPTPASEPTHCLIR
jgi:hypothetical protein